MIEQSEYYKKTRKTDANSNEFELYEQDYDVFPKEGIYIGEFVSSADYKAPALIPLDQTNGVCFLSTPQNETLIKNTMQMMALRLAMTIPPGLCRFTLYDAKGQGAGLIRLSNLNTKIVGEHVITDVSELKSELIKIKNNIPMIIQKVLGMRYIDKTLIDYNEKANELAKPYQFIVLTDVPYSINKEVGDLLFQIVNTGRKAGVYVILNVDTSFNGGGSFDYNPIPLLDVMSVVYEKGNRYYLKNVPNEELLHRFALHLETKFPDNETIEDIQNFINESLKKKQNVSVSLADKFTEKNFWTKNSSFGLEVPIGKVNSTDVQNFELSVEDGRGQSYHHCLIGGSTGSGKTVLLHNIICNTAWLYSPMEVQFLLLDFKEGTEFMIYKDLPHVKVLSVKSEVEFALNVFDFLTSEIETRGELFKRIGVNNIMKYNEKSDKKLPRYIIIIDEFQKLFDGNISIANRFADNISDIGKRGRSFGINMILSTQGLGGVNVGSSLTEFGLRISMRLNSDMECDRLLGSGNTAPRTLTKKGESVYCAGGNVRDNIIYQVAFLSDDRIRQNVKKMLDSFHQQKMTDFSRFIFDGESPANFEDNKILKQQLKPVNGKLRIYIGSPIALEEGHTYYSLHKENGYNVLLVGQDVVAATSIIYYSMKQIIEQSQENSKFVICDKTNSESASYGKYAELSKIHSNLKVVETDSEIGRYVDILRDDLNKRKMNPSADYPRIVMAFHNLYNYRPARMERGELSTPTSRAIMEIAKDGPDFGIHLMAYFDTMQHFYGIFDRRDLSDWRILIELKGGEGYALFGNTLMTKSTINYIYTANLHSAEMDDRQTEKFKVYKL